MPDTRPSNQVRVLFHEAYHDRLFGAVRSLKALATGLDRNRYDPYLLVSARGAVADYFEASGIPTIVLPIHPLLIRYDRFFGHTNPLRRGHLLLEVLTYQGRVARLVRKLGIDILHANTTRALLTSGLGARLGGASVVYHLRGSMDVRWAITHWGSRLAHRILVVDHTLVNSLAGQMSRYVVVPNGIDPAEISSPGPEALWREFDLPVGARVIGTLGYISPVKGQHVLLQALPRVWEQFPETYCFIIGRPVDQEYQAQVAAIHRSLPCPEKVIFTGEREDRLALLGGFDVFVLPSFDEGFPRSILEAMLAAKPVVASPIAGVKEQVVPGETGFLVQPGDAEGLASSLVSLLANPPMAREMGCQGRSRCLERFTIKQMVERVQTVYDELTLGRRK